MRLSEERRYQIERCKDRAPGSNPFIWLIPIFVIITMLTKVEALPEITVDILPIKEVPLYQDAKRGLDPVCHGDRWCFLGWRL